MSIMADFATINPHTESEETLDHMTTEICNLLDEFGYNSSNFPCDVDKDVIREKWLATWEENKGKLVLPLLEASPFYVPSKHYIVLRDQPFEEKEDQSGMEAFFTWAYRILWNPDVEQSRVLTNSYAIRDTAIAVLRIALTESDSAFVLSEDKANDINEELKSNWPDCKIKAAAGQKTVRLVGKIAKATGLDQIKEYKSVIHNGITQEKDYGYAYWFAYLGDMCRHTTKRYHVIISANPVDYLTMSFGHGWASCHTIDKWNKRSNNGSHTYSGCYSSGTVSYMLDPSTVIMYLIDASYKGSDFEYEDKMKRVNIHIGGDKFVEGRLYPDSRDGGATEQDLPKACRNIAQNWLSSVLGVPCKWRFRKGTVSDKDAFTSSGATNYEDYRYYEDCVLSRLKDGATENDPIRIGHAPICPFCGEEHNNEEWIACSDCSNSITCDHCGAAVAREDAIISYDEEHFFCDESCAEEEGYHLCWNDDQWHTDGDEENCWGGSYNYLVQDVDTGHWYSSREAASNNAVVYCEDDNEYHSDYWVDDYDGCCYSLTGTNPIVIRYHSYYDNNEAESDGWASQRVADIEDLEEFKATHEWEWDDNDSSHTYIYYAVDRY